MAVLVGLVASVAAGAIGDSGSRSRLLGREGNKGVGEWPVAIFI
jgi:hypothetical protein